MNIKFKLETLGYIAAEFLIDNNNIKINHSSDYGDKFQELLNEFFIIYDVLKYRNNSYFPYSSEIIWCDDFINYKWELNLESMNSSIKIRVIKFSHENKSQKLLLLEETIEINSLFNQIYISLNDLLLNFGFIGYKANWEVGNFPLYEYITLKVDKEKLEIRPFNVALEDDLWKQKMIIEDELKIIAHKI